MEPNRISNLPDNVIDQILSCLPIKDAAKTSLLSREWRYKWTTTPRLVFDDQSLPPYFDSNGFVTSDRLVSEIDRILLLHFGPICKFKLSYRQSIVPENDIDKWILHPSRHPLKEFEFQMPNNIRYKVPSCIFSCQNLTRLGLRNCLLKPPSTFKGFRSLKSLRLEYVTLDQAAFDMLMSRSARLEELILTDVVGVHRLDINAPNLKCFDFEGPSVDVNLKYTSGLTHFFLYTDHLDRQKEYLGNSINLIKLLSDMARIESLGIIGDYFEHLANGVIPRALPVPCINLYYLSITINLTSFNQTSIFFCLLRSFPNLQQLDVCICTMRESRQSSNIVWQADQYCLTRLQSVEIGSYSGAQAEIDFIRFVLLASPLLLDLTVELDARRDDKSEILKQLQGYKRASPLAKIIVM